MFFRYNFYTVVWILIMLFYTISVRGDVSKHNLLPFLSFSQFLLFIQAFILVFISIVGFSKQQQFAYLKFNSLQIGLIFSLSYVIMLELVYLLLISNIEFNIWYFITNIIGCFVGLIFFYLIYKI